MTDPRHGAWVWLLHPIRDVEGRHRRPEKLITCPSELEASQACSHHSRTAGLVMAGGGSDDHLVAASTTHMSIGGNAHFVRGGSFETQCDCGIIPKSVGLVVYTYRTSSFRAPGFRVALMVRSRNTVV